MCSSDLDLFPSPRGVELHKPGENVLRMLLLLLTRFRPLAGLSCINPVIVSYLLDHFTIAFPSPRGVELHKPRPTMS